MELGRSLASVLKAAYLAVRPAFKLYGFLYLGLIAAVAAVPYMAVVAAFNSDHADLPMAIVLATEMAIMGSLMLPLLITAFLVITASWLWNVLKP